MMRRILIAALLLLLPLGFPYAAGTIQLYPFEYKDFGNASLPTFDMTLMMDCHAAAISAYVRSGGQPVQGATSNLKYVQYDQPLLSSGPTDETGFVSHKLNGNISYMTGIFVLTVEKGGYRRREAHFLISPCFADEPPPAQQGNNTAPAPIVQNNTLPAPPKPPPPANISANAPLNPSTANASGNQSGAGQPKSAGQVLCPFSMAILLSAVFLSRNR